MAADWDHVALVVISLAVGPAATGVGLRQPAGSLASSKPSPAETKPGALRFWDGVEAERGEHLLSYPARPDCPWRPGPEHLAALPS
jgi:hypothetical protein